MKQYEDLSERQFQMLKVLYQADDLINKNGQHERMWTCECLLCGNIITTRERNLKTGHIKTCGKHRIAEDLKGKRFNDLTVIERADNYIDKNGRSHVMWKCQCKCGNTSIVRATSLKNNSIKSCGCSRKKSLMGIGLIDIKDMQFGYWKVLEKSRTYVEPSGRKVTLWKCQCKCGTIRELRAGTLKSGNSLSCGCYKYDMMKDEKYHRSVKSNAEKHIEEWLIANHIYFESQKIYPDLRGQKGYPLSYDFLIYHDDGTPMLFIECQGKQHYQPVEYFGGERQFKIQQMNDDKKREYAKTLNVPLLEIPYTIKQNKDIIQLVNDEINNIKQGLV